jgi:exonuclease 1
MPVPENYDNLFQQAEWTFLYQRVWDPQQNEVVHLQSLPDSILMDSSLDLSFLGPYLFLIFCKFSDFCICFP